MNCMKSTFEIFKNIPPPVLAANGTQCASTHGRAPCEFSERTKQREGGGETEKEECHGEGAS